jgi:uncharacterized Tic20 family protein
MAETQNQTPPVQPPPAGPAPASSSPEKDARLWCMLCHLAIIVPCVPCLLTILIWQLKKNEFPSVDVHGKRALNYQISVFIVMFVCWIAVFILAFIHLGFLSIVMPFIGLAALVFAIIAGIKANNGEDYEYPWSLKLIK